jgi:hypothetical protein
MSRLRSLALEVRPGWPMPGLRHRRYVADRLAEARTLPTEAEVPPQFRPAERQASRTPGAPGKVIGNFAQSNSQDYESNS